MSNAQDFISFEEETLYVEGKEWVGITDDQRHVAFNRLEGEWLYLAGVFGRTVGVTDEQRREAFSQLEGEWLYKAGRDWSGITDEQRRAAFNRLKGEWLYRAGI